MIPAPGPLSALCCSLAMLECSVSSSLLSSGPWPWGLSSVGPPLTTWFNLFFNLDHVICSFPHGVWAALTPSGHVFVNWPLPHPTAS